MRPSWSIPGRERFYTRLDAPPTRESWREAVRAGRTFVTNGPLVELRIGAAQIGDEIVLDAPAPLEVTGVVRFDPTRDDVQQVELLRNGEPIPAPVERVGAGELRLRVAHDVAESAWFALRVSGDKVGEVPLPPALPDWALERRRPLHELPRAHASGARHSTRRGGASARRRRTRPRSG